MGLSMKSINVVAAIIYSSGLEEVFVAKRPDKLHQGGKWEFPGGKIENGEMPEAALVRELNEELGIQAKEFELFEKVSHDYGDKEVHLHFYRVTGFEGEAYGAEGQEVCWMSVNALPELDFPDANLPIVKRLVDEG